MSIGVISGKGKSGLIEVIFEAYYNGMENDNSNSLDSFAMKKLGFSSSNSLNNSSSSSDTFKVLTFDGLQREGSGRWATHEIIGQDRKPVLEFLGPDLETVSFSIVMSAFLGISPIEQIEKLRQMRDEGVICDFLIGGTAITTNQWVLTRLSETHKTYDNAGNLFAALTVITLLEYVKLPEEG